MEADLHQFFHVCPKDLELQEVAGFIRHLPRHAVLMDNDGWSLTDELLSDLMFVHSGSHHPADPRLLREKRARKSMLDARAAIAVARRSRLGINGSVLRQRETG